MMIDLNKLKDYNELEELLIAKLGLDPVQKALDHLHDDMGDHGLELYRDGLYEMLLDYVEDDLVKHEVDIIG